MDYYAHSGRNAAGEPDVQLFQRLAAHLRGVATGACDRATAVGLLHDLGKYRPERRPTHHGVKA